MPPIENPASQNAAIAALGASEQAELPIENVVPCFTPGTVIATPKGEQRVEDLQVGDRVLTRDNGLQEIRWIGSCRLGAEELLKAPSLRPVLIRSGALDHGLPEADILVSPWHNVLIQNDKTAQFFEDSEVLSAAGHLTGLDGVDVVDVAQVTYIHFMFDQHQVVLSNGFWTESFRPDERVMDSLGTRQRRQIFELFPDLRDTAGRKAYQAARRALTEAESRLLLK
ncbi:MAG: Hint domain-containing protein [Roseovarius sp.]|uniref:Hint domain-containing protein n=1 Tax=Roseovarius sp. TaxID=1486281 RepID=UPI0032ED35BF